MEGKCRYAKIITCFLFFLSGCSTSVTTDSVSDFTGIELPDSLQIQHGDMICRLGNGYFSNYFKKCSTTEKIYSHVGILEFRGDSIFVIHAEASEFTGVGHVKREPLQLFLKDIRTWGIYRISPDELIREKIVDNALFYYGKKTPFDMDFNSEDDQEVYCTELLAHTVNKAFEYPLIKPGFTFGSKKLYGVDDTYLVPGFLKIYSTHPDAN